MDGMWTCGGLRTSLVSMLGAGVATAREIDVFLLTIGRNSFDIEAIARFCSSKRILASPCKIIDCSAWKCTQSSTRINIHTGMRSLVTLIRIASSIVLSVKFISKSLPFNGTPALCCHCQEASHKRKVCKKQNLTPSFLSSFLPSFLPSSTPDWRASCLSSLDQPIRVRTHHLSSFPTCSSHYLLQSDDPHLCIKHQLSGRRKKRGKTNEK
ncbi:hypothetical protein BD289DRAFT_273263 [Coniella lustricola]|uniref:Uncharacterized protein n=1 Tax=Coniella lustricola TaxID=2025994 RepID=A0A2T3AKM6_9PEZI|nr:hypothetical protein BD289DRAFT_273263 [Coniella lustricola]